MLVVKAPQLGVHRNQQESPLSAYTRAPPMKCDAGVWPTFYSTSHRSCTVLLRDFFRSKLISGVENVSQVSVWLFFLFL